VAFTFMDLWRHGLPRQAWRFASAYAEHTGDHGGLALLPFFAVYRALVRAQVAALRLAQAGDAAARAAAREALARDLRVAGELSQLRHATPSLVLTCGLSGSGKSTVALALLQPLGAVRVRSDVERKRLAGMASTARPTAEQARQLYSRAMNTRTYARLQSLSRQLLRAGLNVIVDAAALRRHERDELRALAAADAACFVLVECTAPEAVLRERIARRLAADHDASDATLEVLDFQLSVREPVAADEAAVTLATDTDPAELARRCETLAASWLAQEAAIGERPLIPDRHP
jgi:predicted kinase